MKALNWIRPGLLLSSTAAISTIRFLTLNTVLDRFTLQAFLVVGH